eukprot:GHRR01020931.1.p2 GENE.GHRR01020931.1~~GHRR01020931.1.p2  ORF type:complete len:130 (+),score=14.13 GHRR01020931.1:153-542(+)
MLAAPVCRQLLQYTRDVRCLFGLHCLGGQPSTHMQIDTAPEQPDQRSGLQQEGTELPMLCGEPKNKLSLHKRGNRRISYYSKRKDLFAKCQHCGQTGAPHEFLAADQRCIGQCLQPPTKQYPAEYRPPC